MCDEEEDVCDEGHVLSPVLLVNRTGEGRSRGEGKGGGQCGDEELRAGEALVGSARGRRWGEAFGGALGGALFENEKNCLILWWIDLSVWLVDTCLGSFVDA